MEQTAVEWFAREISKINVSSLERFFIEKLKNQAKEMEKEQIMGAYQIADQYVWKSTRKEAAEQYYNETFKK